jgi:ABC-2 type transport system permease protein
MTRLLAFEWRRMRSLAASRALLAGVVGFALLADLAVAGKPLDGAAAAFHLVQRDLPLRWLLAAALGAQGFGHDFRYGTIRPTLLAFPRRGRLLAGRALAAALVGTGAALAATAASLALLLVLASWEPGALADPALWRSLAYGAVTVGLVAALAVGLAALCRGAGLPVVLVACWAGILEPLLAGVSGGPAAAFLPFLSMLQLTAPGGDALGMGAAGPPSAAVFPLCLAATLAAAGVALARRDATVS